MQPECSKNIGLTSGDGATCEPGHRSIRNQLTLFAVDRLASPRAQQESRKESLILGGCGPTPCESSEHCDLALRSSKTQPQLQVLIEVDRLEEFSGSWPASGAMWNGFVCQQPFLVPRISGTGLSFVPTPRACSGLRSSGVNRTEIYRAMRLAGYLPTPTVRAGRSGKASSATLMRNSRPLNEVCEAAGLGTVDLLTMVRWMMGFPPAWSRLMDTETPSSRRSPNGSDAESSKRAK